MPYVSYNNGKYKGFVVRGTVPVPKPTVDSHIDRTWYYTSRLEASAYGTVQNYDGAGMSAGPIHWIAYFPRSKEQGNLWPVVSRILKLNTPAVNEMREEFNKLGWVVGNTVTDSTGKLVPAKKVREELSASNGLVPASGPIHDKAERWANLFNKVFSDPATFDLQSDCVEDYLIKGNQKTEMRAYIKYAVRPPQPETFVSWIKAAPMASVGPELDLAMATYHNFSVNAPAPANACLQKALTAPDVLSFSRKLCDLLKNDDYGNWDVRAAKCRQAALSCGFWTPAVVASILR